MAEGMPSITAETIVEDLVDRYPPAANVFVRRGMHCVGCPIARFETVSEACRIYRQSVDGIMTEILGAIVRPPFGPRGTADV